MELSSEFGPAMEAVVEDAERLEEAMAVAVEFAIDLMERLEDGPLRGAGSTFQAAEHSATLAKAREEACRAQMREVQMLMERTEEKRRAKEALAKKEEEKKARWEAERQRCPIVLPLTDVSKNSLRQFPSFAGIGLDGAGALRNYRAQCSSNSKGCQRPRSASFSRLAGGTRDVFR